MTGRPTVSARADYGDAVLDGHRDRQDQLGRDRRDHDTADHHAGGLTTEEFTKPCRSPDILARALVCNGNLMVRANTDPLSMADCGIPTAAISGRVNTAAATHAAAGWG